MLKNAFVSVTTMAFLLIVLTACAEEDQSSTSGTATESAKTVAAAKKPAGNKAAEGKPKRPDRAVMQAPETQPLEAFQSEPVMGQPVDFSTPENVTASLDAIQKGAGDEAFSRVESAIDYMLVYDLSVGRNKQKLYEKLNGKTPNQILAMTNR